MNSIHSRSVESSEMGDLDGYSIPGDYGYDLPPQFLNDGEDFGFDPPQNAIFPKAEPFSPPTMTDPLQLSGWSGFDRAVAKNRSLALQSSSPIDSGNHSFEFARTFPNPSTVISRFGQVTPPRSNSANSEASLKGLETDQTKTQTAERRKRTSKASVKDESESTQPAATNRKRKNTRKSSTVVKDEQDDKRRQSLEKNRLAAAKCRINKKEKTEQLQRNSHEKAVHNAFLKEQVMRMKEEVQQMNALLLAHANCEGCRSPEEIQKHLSNLGNEFFPSSLSSMNYDYPAVTLDEIPRMVQDSGMTSDYFASPHTNPGLLNPPLPDFDRAAEFEVHTPMQTD